MTQDKNKIDDLLLDDETDQAIFDELEETPALTQDVQDKIDDTVDDKPTTEPVEEAIEDEPAEDPDLATTRKVNELAGLVRTYYAHASKDGDIDPLRGQGRVLALLVMKPETTQKELQFLLNMKQQSLSELLTKLEAKGFIEREKSEEDKRITTVRLTEAGAAAAPNPAEKPRISGAYDCLDDEDRAQFDKSLDVVIASLKEKLDGFEPAGHGCDDEEEGEQKRHRYGQMGRGGMGGKGHGAGGKGHGAGAAGGKGHDSVAASAKGQGTGASGGKGHGTKTTAAGKDQAKAASAGGKGRGAKAGSAGKNTSVKASAGGKGTTGKGRNANASQDMLARGLVGLASAAAGSNSLGGFATQVLKEAGGLIDSSGAIGGSGNGKGTGNRGRGGMGHGGGRH